ncbi:hypothetical protein NE850_01345 [Paraburkholderia sp. USG1]|uniref:hypothetical protein n=1 Tax=Paraburkholderia sp. USG1 TaxID=2952268 RepID=UPI0028589927|nr:hypothetical protein [Paraburkholderia sp. USG1]MDR8394969.1 hypothetical protein [Paraburkholderia sp. USG1]
MLRALIVIAAMLPGIAAAQFTSGQILTATGLNSALGAPTITGGSINGATVGAATSSTGKFTTLTATSGFTATGLVGLANLTTQAANTVLVNATGSSASPTAFAMPSCSSATTALNWTTSSGFGCNSSVNAATLGGATFAAPGAIGGTTPAAASFTSQNLAYTTTYAPGARAPIFIWQNPNGSTSAGYSAGQQIWIGTNPTATPGAGDTVASTIGVANGNNRSILYGQNILVGLCGSVEGCTTSDYINGPVQGQEIDVYGSASWAPSNRAFNATAGIYPINGQEVYCQGPQYCTAAFSAWSAGSTGQNWWKEGLSLDRIYDIGIHFNATSGDTATGFGNAAILDDSNSTIVLQIGSGTHTYYISAPNFNVTGSGVLTAGGGIVGTATNNNASAGNVGEYVQSNSSGTSLSTGVPATCASLPLSAGDWDVRGTVQFVPAGTTTVSAVFAGISTTSASLGGLTGGETGLQATFATGQQQFVTPRTVRITLASSGTVYLAGSLGFGTSTATCSGWIEARRPR